MALLNTVTVKTEGSVGPILPSRNRLESGLNRENGSRDVTLCELGSTWGSSSKDLRSVQFKDHLSYQKAQAFWLFPDLKPCCTSYGCSRLQDLWRGVAGCFAGSHVASLSVHSSLHISSVSKNFFFWYYNRLADTPEDEGRVQLGGLLQPLWLLFVLHSNSLEERSI